MKPPRLPSHTWLAAFAALLLGLLCHWVLRGGERRAIPDTTSSLPSRGDSSQSKSAPLVTGPMTAFLGAIPKASALECETMALEFLEQSQHGKEIELEALFRRWLTLESPEAVLERVSNFDGHWRSDWNTSFFNAWVALDEQAAMADRKYIQLNPARALFAIRNADPNFASYFVNTGHSFSFEDKAMAALTTLARDRPDIARLIADAELSENLKSISAVARGLAINDPEGAIAWLQSLDLAEPGTQLAIVFAEWLRTDPTAATQARERLGLTGLGLRDTVGSQALRTMTSPESAIGQLNLALHRNPFVDVAGLHRQLIESGADFEKPGFIMPAINHDGWYSVDPEAEARAAAELPAGKARDFIMDAICQNWAAHDLNAALRYADEQGLDSPSISFLRKKPTNDLRETVLSAPEEHFANLFGPDGSEGIERAQLYALATEWSAADPIAVANWLLTQELPNQDDRGGAEADMFFGNALGYYWAGNDPLGASRWMEALPDDGPQKSKAWKAMEHCVNQYSPDLAFILSAAYLEGGLRQGYLTGELGAVREDIGLPAAMELLQSPMLSADERSLLAASLEIKKGDKGQ